MEIYYLWSTFKSILNTKYIALQYTEDSNIYYLFAYDNNILYKCEIYKNIDFLSNEITHDWQADKLDFETNYKSKANKSDILRDKEGKQILRAESRPINSTTVFTCIGDDTDIGNGKEIFWDFSNDDDLISVPSGSDYKRKHIEFKFLDSVWIKEGTIYFHNTLKGSYLDFYIVCPQGNYYLDNAGQVQQATQDTPIVHYGIKIFMQGNCPMGDELNTEACSQAIPSNYKFWLDVTVPNTDDNSNGYVTLELYRIRSVIL